MNFMKKKVWDEHALSISTCRLLHIILSVKIIDILVFSILLWDIDKTQNRQAKNRALSNGSHFFLVIYWESYVLDWFIERLDERVVFSNLLKRRKVTYDESFINNIFIRMWKVKKGLQKMDLEKGSIGLFQNSIWFLVLYSWSVNLSQRNLAVRSWFWVFFKLKLLFFK